MKLIILRVFGSNVLGCRTACAENNRTSDGSEKVRVKDSIAFLKPLQFEDKLRLSAGR